MVKIGGSENRRRVRESGAESRRMLSRLRRRRRNRRQSGEVEFYFHIMKIEAITEEI